MATTSPSSQEIAERSVILPSTQNPAVTTLTRHPTWWRQIYNRFSEHAALSSTEYLQSYHTLDVANDHGGVQQTYLRPDLNSPRHLGFSLSQDNGRYLVPHGAGSDASGLPSPTHSTLRSPIRDQRFDLPPQAHKVTPSHKDGLQRQNRSDRRPRVHRRECAFHHDK
jgi:hypothetical protein